MKAVVYERFGGPEVLRIVDVPKPEPRRGEVLVRVRAAAINPIDWKIRTGSLSFVAGRKFPKRTGIDFAGVIEACGEGIVGLRPGDAVLGLAKALRPAHGSFADWCVANAEFVLRKPPRLTDAEAASVPIAGLSALQSLRNCGVGAGSKVMLTGASGGLGTYAIQIARTHGAHVTAVCSTHGVDICRKLGADIVVDRTKEDPLASRGLFDAIIDFASVYSFSRCRPLSTVWAQVRTKFFGARKAHALMMKRSAGDLKELGTLIAAGSVTPVVSRVYAFREEEVREMHRASETGHTIGKLVVEISGG